MILGVLIVASTFGLVGAADVKTVAVLPFDVHSSENIDYIRNGVWDMLISRISLSGKIEVTAKHAVGEALGKKKGSFAVEDVYDLGKKMNVDYVVYGSITKIGNSVSLDGKLLDVATHKSPVDVFSQSQGMDDVIPKIGDFAKRIDYHYPRSGPRQPFGAPPAPSGPPVYGTAPQQPAGPSSSKEPEAIDALRTRQGTFTAVINPEFINAPQSIDRKGFWMSQRFDTEFKGMDIGDVNGDGSNEVVVIDLQNVMIYKKEGKTLKLLQKIPGESYNQYLSVDVADVTGSGKKEIIVTSYNQGLLDSFVLQYKDGKYVKIAKDLRWFLRVIEVLGAPTLVGQKMGIQMPFGTPIHEIVWENGKFREGKRMNIPEGLSVYGLIIEPLDKDGPLRVVAFDTYDYLRVYEESNKTCTKLPNVNITLLQSLWKSDDVFGGSNNYFDLTPSQQQSTSVQYKPYINMRLLAYDINKKGKKEFIVVKNHSTVGRVFQNLRAFTSSEIYDLEWNGMGFVENWKTKKIQGYVADYQIRDIDNDGNPDVVLLVITSLDMGFSPKSTVVSYSLTVK